MDFPFKAARRQPTRRRQTVRPVANGKAQAFWPGVMKKCGTWFVIIYKLRLGRERAKETIMRMNNQTMTYTPASFVAHRFRCLTKGRLGRRTGLTLIEVLSAIAVAAIGVFGVLILVPLASRLSGIGFSNESARQNATNVIAKAKSVGLLNYTRWLLPLPGGIYQRPFGLAEMGVDGTAGTSPNAATLLLGVCLDPVLISAPGFNAADPATAPFNTSEISVFPYTQSYAIPQPPVAARLPRMTISRDWIGAAATGFPVGPSMARTMMGEQNVIKALNSPSDVLAPEQRFLSVPGAGGPVRVTREMDGSKSAVALMLPTQSSSSLIYRMMSLVTNNRTISAGTFDRVFDVATMTNDVVINSDEGVIDLKLVEIDTNLTPPALLPSRGWLILVPYQFAALAPNVQRVGLWNRAQAFQIVSSEFQIGTGDLVVTVIGSPFTSPSTQAFDPRFNYTDANNHVSNRTLTQAIFLSDVVDVRESEVRLDSRN